MFQSHSGYRIEASAGGDSAEMPMQFSMRFNMRAPFATISSSIVRNIGAQSATGAGFRLEQATKTDYPTTLCNNTKPCPDLLGVGVRAKKLLGPIKINVYSVGVYVDAAAVKKALSPKYKDKSASAIASDPKLFEEVINSSSYEKSLRLVISYGNLKRSQFLDALQERLEPRLAKAGEKGSLDAFKKLFDDVSFKKGSEVVFVEEGGKLVTKVDGKTKGTIASPSLCGALFDIYLGADPVAPEAKASFGKSIASILKE